VPADNELYEIEVLEGELVAPGHSQLEAATTERLPGLAGQPAVQTAVAAATGFVAGAATIALLRRYGQSRLERAAVTQALEPRAGQARTYVVTVRQLG
jgi:hypothetical protein